MFNLISEYPVSVTFFMLLLTPFAFLLMDYVSVKFYESFRVRFKRGVKGYKQYSHATKIYNIQREAELHPHSADFWNARYEYLLKNVK